MRDPRFTETILQWYAENGRDLPWRRTRDPYAVWLSEIILQQTRIVQGQSYWERFMAAWPTVEALAAASEDEVLRMWEGLGYYSRARNLHAAARQIADLGHFPGTFEDIRKLKGVGDYTAAAIASIAFGEPVAVVDGNVYRVLARHYAIATPVGSTAAKKEFAALAQTLLPIDEPAAFNQGMMDFGAVQCTPQSPACPGCPLADSCQALRSGRVAVLPVKTPPAPVRTRFFSYVLLRSAGRVAMHKRRAGDIWQGLWEPLLYETPAPGAPFTLPGGQDASALRPVRSGVRHQLTHQTLIADLYEVQTDALPALPEGYIWIPEAELDRYAKPRLVTLLISK